MRKRALFVATTLLAAAGPVACDRGEPGAAPPPGEAVDVSVSEPVRAPATATFPATVVSTDEVELATRASGSIRRMRVDVGSRVAAGDTLVELDASDVRARIEGAEAALEVARKRFERIRSLERDGAATAQELDDARAALRRAEAGLREARAQEGYVVLRAPFGGTVTSRSSDPGDLAVPGRPVLSLVRPASLKILADLPGRVGAGLSEGDRMAVRDPETGRAVPARVARVSPARDPSSRRVRVELRLEEGAAGEAPGLAPGAYVRLERADPEATTVWIPADAVVRRGQLAGVFALRDDRLELRWIRLGVRREGVVEVLAGVTPGDRVVRSPDPALVDGSPVASVTPRPWSPRGDGGEAGAQGEGRS